MNHFRKHWYDWVMLAAFIELIILIVNWDDFSILRTLALANLIALQCKQFEEFRFPGGMPALTNMVLTNKNDASPDRYPLNAHSAFFMNLTATIAFLLPVFFPKAISIGFMPIAFGLLHIGIHYIIAPRRLHFPYSPGMFSILLGHVPIGIYWFYMVITHHWLDWDDVVKGLIYLFLFITIFTLNFGYGLLQSTKSKYPFSPEEMNRGGIIKRLNNLEKKNLS